MSAQVSVVVSASAPQLLIPRSAVKFDGETAKVTRIEANEIRREAAITILAADALSYLVAEDGLLKAGDLIISNWNQGGI
jgi:multidrug efflux pump subunit AcrA (membrane-fusion protein)